MPISWIIVHWCLKVGLPLGGTLGSATLGPVDTGAGGEGALLLIAVGLAFDFGRSSLSREFDLSLLLSLVKLEVSVHVVNASVLLALLVVSPQVIYLSYVDHWGHLCSVR